MKSFIAAILLSLFAFGSVANAIHLEYDGYDPKTCWYVGDTKFCS